MLQSFLADIGDDIVYAVVSQTQLTATQFLQAVGAAEAGYRVSLIPELQASMEDFGEDEVVLVCSGEGATSEGEFWEALNTACNLKLPVVFLIEDNGYAISVPVEVNTAGGSISKLVSGFPDLFIIECDGTDVLAALRARGLLEHRSNWKPDPRDIERRKAEEQARIKAEQEAARRTAEVEAARQAAEAKAARWAAEAEAAANTWNIYIAITGSRTVIGITNATR
ncbi:MAG: hypothetical protein IH784_04715 [Bacteroidetes bacterium]|nr:hypothetical protein [Bacteroidota bacterium]